MQPKHAALVGRSSLSVGCEYGPEGGQDCVIQKKKKGTDKGPGSATITNRNPSQTPRGRGNRQIQTSTNRTNVRNIKISSLFPKRGNRNAKRTEKHKKKMTQVRHKTNRLVA